MFAQELGTTRAQDRAEDERDDDGVVALSGDRDEVVYEVEGQREVADQ